MFKYLISLSLIIFLVIIIGSGASFSKSVDLNLYEDNKVCSVGNWDCMFKYSRLGRFVPENINSEYGEEDRNTQYFDIGCFSGEVEPICNPGELRQVLGECPDDSYCSYSEPHCKLSGCNEYTCVECLNNGHCGGNRLCNSCGNCYSPGGAPCPPEICQVPLSPFNDKNYIVNLFNYFISKNSISNYLFYNVMFSMRRYMVAEGGIHTYQNRAEFQCISSDICSTCIDGFSNDYSYDYDCSVPGCDYDMCGGDDSRNERNRGPCTSYFGESGSLSTLDALCELSRLPPPSDEFLGLGENICLPEAGYVALINKDPSLNGILWNPPPNGEGMALTLCGNPDVDCCVNVNSEDWNENGEIYTWSHFSYPGDNYCQGWLDSGDNGVCRGPYHENPSENCYADPSWSDCQNNPSSCTWDEVGYDIRETYEDTKWTSSIGQTYSDCFQGCIHDGDGNGFVETFNCGSTQFSDCNFVSGNSCSDGSNKIQGLTISNPTGGHLSTDSNYDWIICCSPNVFIVSNSETFSFLSLSGDFDNSHVAEFNYGNGYTNYYIGGQGLSNGCDIVDYNSCSNPDDFCVFSISAETNAHVADCMQEGYDYKLCCS